MPLLSAAWEPVVHSSICAIDDCLSIYFSCRCRRAALCSQAISGPEPILTGPEDG